MIPNELASKYNLPPVNEYPFPEIEEIDWYSTFLIQTDYVANKIAEALYLGEELDEDYTAVLQARKFARNKINELRGKNTNV